MRKKHATIVRVSHLVFDERLVAMVAEVIRAERVAEHIGGPLFQSHRGADGSPEPGERMAQH